MVPWWVFLVIALVFLVSQLYLLLVLWQKVKGLAADLGAVGTYCAELANGIARLADARQLQEVSIHNPESVARSQPQT